MRNIGIDIGKGKCMVCVVDGKGSVLERASYVNTLARRERVCTQDEKRIRREGTVQGRVRVDWKHVAQDI